MLCYTVLIMGEPLFTCQTRDKTRDRKNRIMDLLWRSTVDLCLALFENPYHDLKHRQTLVTEDKHIKSSEHHSHSILDLQNLPDAKCQWFKQLAFKKDSCNVPIWPMYKICNADNNPESCFLSRIKNGLRWCPQWCWNESSSGWLCRWAWLCLI